MPKHPYFESFVHLFLTQLRLIADVEHVLSPSSNNRWNTFISSLKFLQVDTKTIRVSWKKPVSGTADVVISNFTWYFQITQNPLGRKKGHLNSATDIDYTQAKNHKKITEIIIKTCKKAGLTLSKNYTNNSIFDIVTLKHFDDEERLFNAWAQHTDINTIDVMKSNEACTAPEMRYITKKLGSMKGLSLLDLGSGLGEASVYFALKGARVTALDLSSEMLDASVRLAKKYKTKISTIQAAAEYLNIPRNRKFDIIYAGNLFHHVDIAAVLDKLIPHLKPRGVLICWEPVAYNPVINLYRKIVTQVRSEDERPIRISDIALFTKYFKIVETRWFWLTTLLIFCYMALFMHRNPNKERFWKKIVEEGDRWQPIYKPLESLDTLLLKVFPFLRPLCWNVVITCRLPRTLK